MLFCHLQGAERIVQHAKFSFLLEHRDVRRTQKIIGKPAQNKYYKYGTSEALECHQMLLLASVLMFLVQEPREVGMFQKNSTSISYKNKIKELNGFLQSSCIKQADLSNKLLCVYRLPKTSVTLLFPFTFSHFVSKPHLMGMRSLICPRISFRILATTYGVTCPCTAENHILSPSSSFSPYQLHITLAMANTYRPQS